MDDSSAARDSPLGAVFQHYSDLPACLTCGYLHVLETFQAHTSSPWYAPDSTDLNACADRHARRQPAELNHPGCTMPSHNSTTVLRILKDIRDMLQDLIKTSWPRHSHMERSGI